MNMTIFRYGVEATASNWEENNDARLLHLFIADRADYPGGVSSYKGILRHVLCNHRTGGNDRIFAYGYTTNNRGSGCNPDSPFDDDGVSNRNGTTLRGINGMAGCQDTHSGSDHYIILDSEATQVIQRAILVD